MKESARRPIGARHIFTVGELTAILAGTQQLLYIKAHQFSCILRL